MLSRKFSRTSQCITSSSQWVRARAIGRKRERTRSRRTRGEGGHWTVAATYVENRVTNHKRVYGGASDHWPQRIIDGYGRCRVSIRRTIEMKGCTRTVKADLVAIPRRTSGAAGIAIPSSRPPACVRHSGTTPTSTRMGRDSIAKHYPYRPTFSIS